MCVCVCVCARERVCFSSDYIKCLWYISTLKHTAIVFLHLSVYVHTPHKKSALLPIVVGECEGVLLPYVVFVPQELHIHELNM